MINVTGDNVWSPKKIKGDGYKVICSMYLSFVEILQYHKCNAMVQWYFYLVYKIFSVYEKFRRRWNIKNEDF